MSFRVFSCTIYLDLDLFVSFRIVLCLLGCLSFRVFSRLFVSFRVFSRLFVSFRVFSHFSMTRFQSVDFGIYSDISIGEEIEI